MSDRRPNRESMIIVDDEPSAESCTRAGQIFCGSLEFGRHQDRQENAHAGP